MPQERLQCSSSLRAGQGTSTLSQHPGHSPDVLRGVLTPWFLLNLVKGKLLEVSKVKEKD